MPNGNRATEFRKLISKPGIVSMPGVYDCLTVKIVEATGFPAAFIGDGAVSVSRLGLTDFGFVAMGEIVDRAREVCNCTAIAVIVDIGTGYGNALNIQRTVSEIESTGACGVFFEDQTWPKKCGHLEGRSLISKAEMSSKIRAAADARDNQDFMIVTRTDALAIEGWDETIMRANTYGEAGADMVFIDALESLDDLKRAPQEISYPMMVNMLEGGKTPLVSASDLEQMGYKIVIWPETLMYAGFPAMMKVATELEQYGELSSATLSNMSNFREVSNFLGLKDLYELEAKYSTNIGS